MNRHRKGKNSWQDRKNTREKTAKNQHQKEQPENWSRDGGERKKGKGENSTATVNKNMTEIGGKACRNP